MSILGKTLTTIESTSLTEVSRVGHKLMVLEMVAPQTGNAEGIDIVWPALKDAAVFFKNTELVLRTNLNISYWPSTLYL